MSDIVERIRQIVRDRLEGFHDPGICAELTDAADEIERLCTSAQEARQQLQEALTDAIPYLETLHSLIPMGDARRSAFGVLRKCRAALAAESSDGGVETQTRDGAAAGPTPNVTAGIASGPSDALHQAKAALMKIRGCSIRGAELGYGEPERWGDALFASHADVAAALKSIDAALALPEGERAPKVRTSHHRNKEEAARLQALVDERYAADKASTLPSTDRGGAA